MRAPRRVALAMTILVVPAFAQVKSGLPELPLLFVQNRGVYPDQVAYYVRGSDKTLLFSKDGVTFALMGKDPSRSR